MFSIITCAVIFITAFSITKKPTKNRKKTKLNCGNTTLCKHVGVQERGQCPLIPLHMMSGTMMTLIKTNMRQSFCVIIKVLFMTE